jgi:hypothetical protein
VCGRDALDEWPKAGPREKRRQEVAAFSDLLETIKRGAPVGRGQSDCPSTRRLRAASVIEEGEQ